MSYMDTLAVFDDKRDVSSAAGGGAFNIGTVGSDKSYDTAAVGVPNAVGPGGAIGGTLIHDIGRGKRPKLVTQVTTTLVGATATLKVNFICSAAAALSAPTILLSTDAIAIASLAAGYRFRWSEISGVVPQQFVGCSYTIATANITAGNISSWLAFHGADDHADILG